MAGIRLVDVTKTFGGIRAVDRIRLEVEDREFAVLVGPSGCGKTTILRMIAGLEDVSQGEIFIGDRKVNHVPPKARNIAMVFQSYALYPHMTVFKNMAFGLKLRKTPAYEITSRVQEAADMLGIRDLLPRKPRELSGGQRQRVAMGRAVVRDPEVFLFDEPLSNLDAKLRVQMRGELSRLHERLKTTIVYVTHDQIEAMTLADRMIVMNQGIIRQVGRPMEVYHHPKDVFVAGFIGSPAMNLLDAVIESREDGLYVTSGNIRLPVPPNLCKTFQGAAGRSVVFGMRPEHIDDGELKAPFPGGENLEVLVDLVEPVGSGATLMGSCGPWRLTACVDPGTEARPGRRMVFLLNMHHMYLFDKDTGVSLTSK